MPRAVHQIEKGMMGWDPNGPTENPSLLLLPASSFSRTFRDQRPTHNKKGCDGERRRSGGGGGEKCTKERDGSRKDALIQRNPCSLTVITPTQGLLASTKTSQRDFLKNACETSTLSQGSPPTSAARWSIFRPQLHPNMLDSAVRKWCATLILPKKDPFSLWGAGWSSLSPCFHSSPQKK